MTGRKKDTQGQIERGQSAVDEQNRRRKNEQKRTPAWHVIRTDRQRERQSKRGQMVV